MKFRTVALGGIAALMIGGPAAASVADGWYLGLGGGWDHLGNFHTKFEPNGPDVVTGTSDSALVTGAFGYRLLNGIRLEAELGWSQHDAGNGTNPFTGASTSGRITNLTGFFNANYDIHLTPDWDFTFGAGAGVRPPAGDEEV